MCCSVERIYLQVDERIKLWMSGAPRGGASMLTTTCLHTLVFEPVRLGEKLHQPLAWSLHHSKRRASKFKDTHSWQCQLQGSRFHQAVMELASVPGIPLTLMRAQEPVLSMHRCEALLKESCQGEDGGGGKSNLPSCYARGSGGICDINHPTCLQPSGKQRALETKTHGPAERT